MVDGLGSTLTDVFKQSLTLRQELAKKANGICIFCRAWQDAGLRSNGLFQIFCRMLVPVYVGWLGACFNRMEARNLLTGRMKRLSC